MSRNLKSLAPTQLQQTLNIVQLLGRLTQILTLKSYLPQFLPPNTTHLAFNKNYKAGKNAKATVTLEDNLAGSYKAKHRLTI